MQEKAKKIILGMSGGVDSSVSGYLLKKEGYQVQGVYFLFSESGEKEEKIKKVQKIAEKLGIPLTVCDIRKDFEKKVIKYFLSEYQKGRTPNPCVFCNREFKFPFLFQEMKKQGADFVATGHYAQIKKEKINSGDVFELFEGKDKNKDQSYFLYRLTQKQLSKVIFPLGKYKKEKVKKIANELGLPVEKKESQDICFLERGETVSFLEKKLKLTPGNIKNERGKVVGIHKGIELFTKGQRKNINLGGRGPFYVFRKNPGTGDLWVTNDKKNNNLFCREFQLSEVNWISEEPDLSTKKMVRLRYRQPLGYAIIKKKKGKFKVKLEKPQVAVTQGQSAVFYEKNGQVLGGGIIEIE